METTRVGLMGFGRIGRNLFRILYQRDDIRLAAISDIADHKSLEYLLRFDTILGPFPDDVSDRARYRGVPEHPSGDVSASYQVFDKNGENAKDFH